MKGTRIIFALFALSIAHSCMLFADSPKLGEGEPQKRNNILFIIADDWGKHAASYGTGAWIKMPTFDRVASEGILFNNCFTSNPKRAPCRASITTGRNTWQLREGVQHYNPWPKGFVTYADILEENGYFVGYTGKGWGRETTNRRAEKTILPEKLTINFSKNPPRDTLAMTTTRGILSRTL